MTEEVTRGHDLLRRFSSLQERAEYLDSQVRNEEALLGKARSQHKHLLKSSEGLVLAIAALKQAIVPLTERGLKSMQDLVTFGLGTIFFDCKYGLEVDIQERGNDKTAEFWLLEGEPGDQLRVKVRDACGGGVKTVISLILRVYFILHYKNRRTVLLDEPFTDLNTRYVPGLFKFLQYTVEELGFRWLIVTQDDRFPPYGDRIYHMTKGKVEMTRDGKGRGDGSYA